jgi:membrane protein required for beta-lactamase induction
MRPGPLEIVTIIAIIVAISLVVRIFRTRRKAGAQSNKPTADTVIWQRKEQTNQIRRRIRRTGTTFILAGIILLLASISMFRWAFQSYMWSFIIIALGLALILLSRKK